MEEELKSQLDCLKIKLQQLNKVKSLEKKNERYKNDEKFREDKKKRGLEYYYRVVKPARVARANTVAVEDKVVSLDFNQAYD